MDRGFAIGQRVEVVTWFLADVTPAGKRVFVERLREPAEVVSLTASNYPRLVRYADGAVRKPGYEQGVFAA